MITDMTAYYKAMTGNGPGPLPSNVKVRGRLTASQINAAKPAPRELTLNASAANTPIPLIYGRKNVPGIISAYAEYGGDLYALVIWGAGECRGIESVFINDAAPVSGVEVRHYRGSLCQAADSWFAAAIVLYDDTLILTKPAGNMGICYSVFKIPSSFTAAPQFQAIVKGKLVFDPDSTSTGDPFYDDVGASFHFTSTTDASINAHTLTLNNGAAISGGQLVLDGTDDYASLVDHTALEFGTGPWSLEVRCTPDVVSSVTDVIASKGTGAASNYSLSLARYEDDIRLSLSTNGTSYNLLSAVTVATAVFAVGVELVIELEYTGDEYVLWVNGDETWRLAGSTALQNVAGGWQIGAINAGNCFDGSVRSFRFTKNYLRYGGCHTVTATPFSDSDTYVAGMVYSDNPALVFADIATSPIYGMGATVSGLAAAKAWCDEEIETAIERARISIAITNPQKTEQHLDLIASYADMLWVHQGSEIKMMPDRPVSEDYPSGQELVVNGGFASGTGWTIESGWSISGGVAQV